MANTYTNHSGGAIGSDTWWDNIGKQYNVNSNHYYIKGFKTPRGNSPIITDDYTTIDSLLIKTNEVLKRKFPTKNEYVNMLLRRNVYQVLNSEAIYAISSITNKIVDGGTGWAVHLGILLEKPVFVFDQKVNSWYTWNKQLDEKEHKRIVVTLVVVSTALMAV